MKKLLVVICIFPLIANAQFKMNLNENFTGSYNTIKAGQQLLFAVTTTNIFEYSKFYADINPNYNLGYVANKMSSNEFLTREDIGLHYKKFSFFAVNQYNTSFIRSIKYDDWYGVGIGRSVNIRKFRFALSYCFEYQFRQYEEMESEIIMRNSIRAKITIDYSNVIMSFEYYVQPAIKDFSDLNVFGSTSISIFSNKPVSFVIQNTLSYMSTDVVKTIQNTTAGIKIKISK